LSSIKNFELYQDDLEGLIQKNPKVYLPVYHYHRGLLMARMYKKECKKLGLKKLHFAVYSSAVVAVHLEKQETQKIARTIVLPNDQKQIVFDKV